MNFVFKEIGESVEIDGDGIELDATGIDKVLVVRCDLSRFAGQPEVLANYAKRILDIFHPRFEHVLVVAQDVEFLTLQEIPGQVLNEGFRD